MKCPNCQSETFHLKTTPEGTTCPSCGGFAMASGARVDGMLSRSSFRIREQQSRFEGDTLPAHIYDKAKRRAVPNPEFIKRYADKAYVHYKPQELRKEGYKDLANKVENRSKGGRFIPPEEDVKFKGSTKKGIRDTIKKLK